MNQYSLYIFYKSNKYYVLQFITILMKHRYNTLSHPTRRALYQRRTLSIILIQENQKTTRIKKESIFYISLFMRMVLRHKTDIGKKMALFLL